MRRSASPLALGALLAVALIAGPPAAAQDFWNEPAYGTPRKAKKAKSPPSVVSDATVSAKRKQKTEPIAERRAAGPLVVNVSLNRQRLTVYDAHGAIASSPVSSGRAGYATPAGVYTIVQKKRMHYSNLYASAPMPNMQRLTWSGVALHAGALPGYPASHGCIRLPHGFSKKLFGMTGMGTRVIVSRDPVVPVAIVHERLFTAAPPDDDVAAVPTPRETKVADASGATGASDDAAHAEPGPLSYRERRRIAGEKLNAEIRTAGYARLEKQIALAAAQRAAAPTRKPLVEARAEAERLDAHLHELEDSFASAERELADLTLPPEKAGKRKSKAMEPSKRIAKIATLEERLARLPSEIEATRIARQQAEEALANAERVAKEAEDRRTAAMQALMLANAELERGLSKERAMRKLAELADRPVSVFISRAKQRLYVRQGYDDIFDVEVTFDRPDDPVGTHVFTALAVAENKTDMTWSVASIPYGPSRNAAKKKSRSLKAPEPVPAVNPARQTAAAALDRITIPEDARAEISDVMKPGSSIVISDLGIGNETGAYTDFIVPLR
jgi:lipoprotein-anchoring transpeptidase ErfK/SrfK